MTPTQTKVAIGVVAGIAVGSGIYFGFVKKYANGLTWYQGQKVKGIKPRTFQPPMGTDANTNQTLVASPGADGSRSIVGRFDPKAGAKKKNISVGCTSGSDCPTGYQCIGGKCVPFA